MDSIGKYLQMQREALNLTLQDVSERTKLKLYILQQLENDDFQAIGDIGYIKILLITFCRAVQGDEGLIQAKISTQLIKPPEFPIRIKTAKNVKPFILTMNTIYFILLGILSLILSLSLITVYRKGTFSFNEIRKQLVENPKKGESFVPMNDSTPDSLWVQHRKIFDEYSTSTKLPLTLLNEAQLSDTTKVINGTSQKPISLKNYTTEQNDYIGQIIFHGVESPININLEQYLQ